MTRRVRSRICRNLEALESRCLMSAELLQDINSYGAYPSQPTMIDGQIYFRIMEPSGSFALERTDGSGPPQVVEQFGGEGVLSFPPYPVGLVPFQGSVYQLVLDDTSRQTRIEKIDPVSDTVTTAVPLDPDVIDGRFTDHLTAVNDRRMIFTDYHPDTRNTTLYGTDGTPGGTVKLTDGLDGWDQFEQLGSEIVFLRGASETTSSLWITDGTPEGTRPLVAEPGVIAFKAAGDKILYSHESTTTVPSYYVASVDAAGATQILTTDVFVNLIGGSPDGTGYFNDLIQSRPIHLYKTDGTTAGTRVVTTIPWNDAPNLLVRAVAGGKAYMTTIVPTTGQENGIWVSDGTAEGTFRITPNDTTHVGEAPVANFPSFLSSKPIIVPVGDRVFFALTTSSLGSELWTSDGTLSGTHPVSDFVAGPDGSNPLDLTPTPDGLLFAAHEADGRTGVYLAAPDGSGITTVVHMNIDQTLTSFPGLPVTVGDKTFFSALPRTDQVRTWVTDGTPAGTFDLSDQVPGMAGIYSIPYGTVGDKALIGVGDTNPVFWESDGTPAGTFKVGGIPTGAVITQGQKSGDSTMRTVIGSQTFSIAMHDDGSQTLQVVNSSTGKTTALKSFPNAPRDQFPVDGVAYAGKFYYLIPAGPDRGLYMSDGTVAGTVVVARPTASTVNGLSVVGDQLTFFLYRDPSDRRMPPGIQGGDYMMASNGTYLGTYMVTRVGNYTQAFYSNDHAVAKLSNGQYVVFANDGVHGTEPMVVTPDVPPPALPSAPPRTLLAAVPSPASSPQPPTIAQSVQVTPSVSEVVATSTLVAVPSHQASPPLIDPPPTTVTSVIPSSHGGTIDALLIHWSGPLNDSLAGSTASYRVVRRVTTRRGTFRDRLVPVRSASYDAASQTVTLTLRPRVPVGAGGSMRVSASDLLDSHGGSIVLDARVPGPIRNTATSPRQAHFARIVRYVALR